MYQVLLIFHSFVRWLVLTALFYSIYRSYKGYVSGSAFNARDNFFRHRTATIAHVQLVIGFTMYLKSPVIAFFFSNMHDAIRHGETTFFALIHFSMMLCAIVLITIGSAMAKRKKYDREKFKTILIWFSIGLFIILLAIPWPFSPLAGRPYIRLF